MCRSSLNRFRNGLFYTGIFLFLTITPALAGLSDMFGKKEIDEKERQETIERIDDIQDKLKLLQEKLRVLERRKAAKQAAQKSEGVAGAFPETPVQINWQPVDEETSSLGEFGLYTYLLFKGKISDNPAVGTLEDFILTIETLPGNDIPAGLANRFLVPVEKPQSMISLGRQPYDFKLNEAYLRRLELQDDLPNGPVLVSLSQPLDPHGNDGIPTFLAVSLGHQTPQRALELAKIWHNQETYVGANEDLTVSTLFWELIDGAGPTRVTRYKQRILVALPQQ